MVGAVDGRVGGTAERRVAAGGVVRNMAGELYVDEVVRGVYVLRSTACFCQLRERRPKKVSSMIVKMKSIQL